MSVSDHLRIDLAEYDPLIRTFVPDYEELVRIVGESVRFVGSPDPRIVDLGVGTGALALACLRARPGAELVGIDNDPGMLEAAKVRLAEYPRVKLVEGDLLRVDLPACNAIVACISLHHVRTEEEKRAFYAKCRFALRPSGILVSGDLFPAVEPALAAEHREAWLTHLQKSYSRAEAEAHLAAWAEEDVYFPLRWELGWLEEADSGRRSSGERPATRSSPGLPPRHETDSDVEGEPRASSCRSSLLLGMVALAAT